MRTFASARFRERQVTLVDFVRGKPVSARYARRLFRAAVGISFKSFVRQLRLEAATELLRSTDMKVKEIAFGLGYHDTAAFCNDFRSVYHARPSQWRKRRQAL